LPHRVFSFCQRDLSIAALHFFQLAGAISQLPFDCCFLVLRLFAAIWRNTQASCQPFGAILKPRANRLAQYSASRQPLTIQSIALPSGAKLKHLAPIGR
jgi:hypothetical protein